MPETICSRYFPTGFLVVEQAVLQNPLCVLDTVYYRFKINQKSKTKWGHAMLNRRFSFVDVFAVLVGTAVIASIGLIGISRQREAQRFSHCSNNMKQLGLAIHNYHSAFKRLPAGCGGSSAREGATEEQNNAGRLSPFVAILPFMEEQRLWQMVSNRFQSKGKVFPTMGPVPWYDPAVYKPWSMRPKTLVCPTDQDAAKFPLVSSYVINYGDAVDLVGYPLGEKPDARTVQAARASNRGPFTSSQLRFRDILDGLSNTLMFSEAKIAGPKVAKSVSDLAKRPSAALRAASDPNTQYWPDGRNSCWADGTLRSVGFQTILPPNKSSATSDEVELEGVMTPSSHHAAGGVHIGLMDGAVLFALDSIDTGDSSRPTVAFKPEEPNVYTAPGSKSPYGLWGALGTRANKEVIAGQDSPSVIPPPRDLTQFEKERLSQKPLQQWTSRDGKRKISGRQIEIQRESNLMLLTDAGEMKRVPLSALKSEDAFRAVENHFAKRTEAQNSLEEQLTAGLKLLENKQYAEFAKNYLPGGHLDPQGMGKRVAAERGLLIYRFDTGLRALKEPGSAFGTSRSGVLMVKFDERYRPIFAGLDLIYKDDHWQFAPPR